MNVKALRGVCIGVDRHLKVGDTADVDTATSQFLISIGAVEPVAVEANQPAPSVTHVKTDKKEKEHHVK